jgi:hypothetical protein
MPAHPFMPMSKEYLEKLLRASWEIEKLDGDGEMDSDDELIPYDPRKKTGSVVKEDSLYPARE